jgi:hypothetical protein
VNGVKISDPYIVENNCYYMKGAKESGEAEPIKCVSGVTEQNRSFVNITCIPDVFGYEGSKANTDLMFKIGGLTNPRF